MESWLHHFPLTKNRPPEKSLFPQARIVCGLKGYQGSSRMRNVDSSARKRHVRKGWRPFRRGCRRHFSAVGQETVKEPHRSEEKEFVLGDVIGWLHIRAAPFTPNLKNYSERTVEGRELYLGYFIQWAEERGFGNAPVGEAGEEGRVVCRRRGRGQGTV